MEVYEIIVFDKKQVIIIQDDYPAFFIPKEETEDKSLFNQIMNFLEYHRIETPQLIFSAKCPLCLEIGHGFLVLEESLTKLMEDLIDSLPPQKQSIFEITEKTEETKKDK